MKYLYYGMYGYLILYFLVSKSILSLLFGLIQVWIIYQAYATASFCQTMFCIFILFMNAFQILPIVFMPVDAYIRVICLIMSIYNIVGLIWSYQAFCAFKQAFNDMHAGIYGGGGYGSSGSMLPYG